MQINAIAPRKIKGPHGWWWSTNKGGTNFFDVFFADAKILTILTLAPHVVISDHQFIIFSPKNC